MHKKSKISNNINANCRKTFMNLKQIRMKNVSIHQVMIIKIKN